MIISTNSTLSGVFLHSFCSGVGCVTEMAVQQQCGNGSLCHVMNLNCSTERGYICRAHCVTGYLTVLRNYARCQEERTCSQCTANESYLCHCSSLHQPDERASMRIGDQEYKNWPERLTAQATTARKYRVISTGHFS